MGLAPSLSHFIAAVNVPTRVITPASTLLSESLVSSGGLAREKTMTPKMSAAATARGIRQVRRRDSAQSSGSRRMIGNLRSVWVSYSLESGQ
jgi:hypothetical protein